MPASGGENANAASCFREKGMGRAFTLGNLRAVGLAGMWECPGLGRESNCSRWEWQRQEQRAGHAHAGDLAGWYLRHRREGGTVCFNWSHLESHNIFLQVPTHRIEQWSGAIQLIYYQLIRYLERRPERYSSEGRGQVPMLILLEKCARFGKLEGITAAPSTLRSKSVNFCLMVQSIA